MAPLLLKFTTFLLHSNKVLPPFFLTESKNKKQKYFFTFTFSVLHSLLFQFLSFSSQLLHADAHCVWTWATVNHQPAAVACRGLYSRSALSDRLQHTMMELTKECTKDHPWERVCVPRHAGRKRVTGTDVE